MNIRKPLASLAVLAAVGAPAGLLLSSQANAQPTHGPETINVTLYEVGTSTVPSGDIGGGPFKAGGVVVGKGNAADLPDGSVIFALPTGTFTVGPLTGGKYILDSLNPVTCAFVANLVNSKGTITTGTGIFASTTGKFKVNALVTGTASRNTTTGACDLNGIDIEDTVQASALGNINLH